MKNIIRMITILLTINIIIILLTPYSFGGQAEGAYGAGSGESSQFTSIVQKAKDFINRGSEKQTISQNEVENELMPLARVLMGIAILVLLVVGAILGVKYMISGANERAGIKEKLIWYVVAAVLIFGAVAIFNIVVRILNNVSD